MLREEEFYMLGWEGACVEVVVTEPPTHCARCRRDQEDIYPSSAFAKWEGCIVYHIMMNFTRRALPQKGFET